MVKTDLSRQIKDFVVPSQTVMRHDQTVDEVVKALREQKIDERIIYFYVVDKKFHLKGVVSTRNLLLSHPEKTIEEIMESKIISISANQLMKEALESLTHHRLLAMPVVDDQYHLLGTVEIHHFLEKALPSLHKKAPMDIFHILGLTLEEGKMHSSWASFRNRMPWICCNLVGGTGCAIISRYHETVLAKVLLLAMFIPLVLTVSEAISMQSLSYSLQYSNRVAISWKSIMGRILNEGRMIFLVALACGLIVGALSLLWGGGGRGPAFTIFFGVSLSILASASLGASIPLILQVTKVNPQVAAGPIVLMFVDIFTTAIYLTLASWWLL